MPRPKKNSSDVLVNIGVKVHPDVDTKIATIASGDEDRTKGYVARKLLLRGLAAYESEGNLSETDISPSAAIHSPSATLVRSIQTDIAKTLDSELRRVAKAEGQLMDELIEEVAGLLGVAPRAVYNYRSGKWLLPAATLPVLCSRFNSSVLVDILLSNSTQVATRSDR